jgi:hypothetical protein
VKYEHAELLHAVLGVIKNIVKQKLYEGIQRPLVAL